MIPTRDLDQLLSVLDTVTDRVRDLRTKAPAARDLAQLVPLAKSLKLAVAGMEKLAAGETSAAEPRKARRLKK